MTTDDSSPIATAPSGSPVDTGDRSTTGGTAAPAPRSARAAALAAFDRAVAGSAGYRRWLTHQGVDPARVTAIEEVPYLDKAAVFAADVRTWIAGGGPTRAAELVTSSGHSGTFSVGVSSAAERDRLAATADRVLRSLGAGPGRPALLLNCLPMGIAVPTSVATVASPSVHLEMATELVVRFGSSYDVVCILAEPVFGKELAERLATAFGTAGPPCRVAWIIGGEWVPTTWRRHVEACTATHGPDDPGVLLSMGAAEVGLHLFAETPELRDVRDRIDAAGAADAVFGTRFGYTPVLFATDPGRLHVEARDHADGTSTLVLTPLGDRALPLVRYDLDDLGVVVDGPALRSALAAAGIRTAIEPPVVACWGRRGGGVAVGDRVVRPELVKQVLHATTARASVVTGRFRLVGGPDPVVHVQVRPGIVPPAGLDADLAGALAAATGAAWRAEVHDHRAYPYHLPGDHQHKPTYVGTA